MRAAATRACTVMRPRGETLPATGALPSTDRRCVLQLLRLVVCGESVDELAEVAVQDLGQPVRREVDAVIGDAVLREIIGTDLLRTLARADLAAAIFGDRLLLFAQLHLVQPGAE